MLLFGPKLSQETVSCVLFLFSRYIIYIYRGLRLRFRDRAIYIYIYISFFFAKKGRGEGLKYGIQLI